jgi:hypothetical protein
VQRRRKDLLIVRERLRVRGKEEGDTSAVKGGGMREFNGEARRGFWQEGETGVS